MSAYSELMKSPLWQKKRLEILSRDGWTCKRCKSKDKTLHVHHISYSYGKKPWEYDSDSLTTLCEECHERFTEIDKRFSKCISAFKRQNLFAAEYLMGFAVGNLYFDEARFAEFRQQVPTSCEIQGFLLARGNGFIETNFPYGLGMVVAMEGKEEIEGSTYGELHDALVIVTGRRLDPDMPPEKFSVLLRDALRTVKKCRG